MFIQVFSLIYIRRYTLDHARPHLSIVLLFYNNTSIFPSSRSFWELSEPGFSWLVEATRRFHAIAIRRNSVVYTCHRPRTITLAPSFHQWRHRFAVCEMTSYISLAPNGVALLQVLQIRVAVVICCCMFKLPYLSFLRYSHVHSSAAR